MNAPCRLHGHQLLSSIADDEAAQIKTKTPQSSNPISSITIHWLSVMQLKCTSNNFPSDCTCKSIKIHVCEVPCGGRSWCIRKLWTDYHLQRWSLSLSSVDQIPSHRLIVVLYVHYTCIYKVYWARERFLATLQWNSRERRGLKTTTLNISSAHSVAKSCCHGDCIHCRCE